MEERVNQVGLIFGTRGSGKTFFTKEELIPAYRAAHPDMKVLIVDTLDHPDYRDIPAIKPEMIKYWNKPSIYRCFSSDTAKVFRAVRDHLYNCMVVWEDASKYMEGKLDNDVKRFVLDTKQRNVDIFFMFHGFGFAPPQLIQIADLFTIFRCGSPAQRKAAIGNYDEVYKVWEKVQKSKKRWPHQTLRIN